MPISYERLAADPEHAADQAAALDPADPADRLQAVHALQALAQQLVIPAAPLLTRSPNDPTHLFFDLEAVAGSEFSGLLLGSLAAEFPALRAEPPDAATLTPILDALGLEVAEPARAGAFFRAWMAQRATHVMRPLLQMLAAGPVTAAERAVLEPLAQAPLPGIERQLVRQLLDRDDAAK
jgi:hypothetical protein